MFGSALGVEPATLVLFAAIGFLASGHCVGMCGPLVSLYADRMPEGRRPEIAGHLRFNLGRTVSYALLGAAFGALGGATTLVVGQLPAPFAALRGVVGVGVGLLVVAAGLAQLAGTPNPLLSGEARVLWEPLGRLSRVVRRSLDDWLDGPGAVALGLAHGVFPCPLLYPAYLYAFAVADPVAGALSLAALGVGTVPALLLFGVAFDPARLGRTSSRAIGAAFLLLGLGTAYAGLRAMGLPLPAPDAIPLATPPGASLPVVVAVPIAVVGSLLLLGTALSVLAQRRSRSYLFLALAFAAFAGRVLAGRLGDLGVLSAARAHELGLVADAAIVVLLVAAVHAVARPTARDDVPSGGEEP